MDRSGSQERWYRLNRFAEANGMQYIPNLPGPGLPGMIFGVGSARAASDLLRGEQPRFVEFGNYRYTTGSGKNRTTHTWGYVAIKLDVPLPNIVLDATGNNGLFGASNLAAAFDRDQRLSLEGDFDTYFSLYCPQGYERDALYLFTPDIMARFVDNAAALDVEIVDDWLFLYAHGIFQPSTRRCGRGSSPACRRCWRNSTSGRAGATNASSLPLRRSLPGLDRCRWRTRMPRHPPHRRCCAPRPAWRSPAAA